jgi:glutaredoxin-like YruB-family protein
MSKVTIYSTPTCTYCELAKQFFTENGVSYEEFDVAADNTKLQEMVEMSGQMGVPVINIDDQIVVGFDEGKVKEMLGM